MVKINLLKERTVEQPTAKIPTEHKPVQGILIIVLILIAAVAFGVWYGYNKYREKEDLKAKVEKLRIEANNINLEEIQKKIKDLEKLKTELQERQNLIKELRESQKGPVEMLNAFILSIPDTKDCLWFESLNQKRDPEKEVVQLDGTAIDQPFITDFVQNLQGKGYFTTVDLLKTEVIPVPSIDPKMPEMKRYKFTVVCKKLLKKEAKNG